ncbi:MAG: hypothetical protein IJ009_03745 [Clostridia bacterium]|nr:hypothetical protein [Clostridia bacterium]
MKKLFSTLLVAVLLLGTLTACMGGNKMDDPIFLAQILDEDYDLGLIVDDEDVSMHADDLEIREKGISWLLWAEPSDDGGEKLGCFIFCEDVDTAKKMAADLEKYLDKNDELREFMVRCTIERSGDMVFFGCEDVWEDAQEA